jgi:Ca2+:H+ antiporter
VSEALLVVAREEAGRLSHGYVGTEHLLLALLRLQEPSLLSALEAAGITPAQARSRLEKGRRGRRPPVRPGEDGQPGLTSHARRALDAAAGESAALVEGFLRDDGSLLTRLLRSGQQEREKEKAAPSAASSPGGGGPPPPVAEPRNPPGPPTAREPGPKREAQRSEAEPRSRSRASGLRTRHGGARLESADAALDDEPPFIPRLAVQPRQRRRFPWAALPLLLVPMAMAPHLAGASMPTVLVGAAIGILLLAGLLGAATDALAARVSPALGGLVRAVAGQAAVLIIAVLALGAGLTPVVKAAIIGSVLGSLLLVLGTTLLAARTAPQAIRRGRAVTEMGGAMPVLAISALALPSLAHHAGPLEDAAATASISIIVAAILALTFLCSLWYALRTGHPLFGGESGRPPEETWSWPRAALVMVTAIAGLLVLSPILVKAIGEVTATHGWPPLFLGLILIPVIGSAAAQTGAIRAARAGQSDLAIRIAAGAGTQAVLVLAPVLMAAGLVSGVPFDLVFTPFELVSVAIAGIGAALIVRDGEPHGFAGVQLVSVYLLIAVAAWFI